MERVLTLGQRSFDAPAPLDDQILDLGTVVTIDDAGVTSAEPSTPLSANRHRHL